MRFSPRGSEKKGVMSKEIHLRKSKIRPRDHHIRAEGVRFCAPEGPEKRGYVKRDTFNKNRKLDLGTIKVESGMSGLGPEVPKKRHCGGMCQILSRRNARIDR